ncbi:MAG TPA: hypothetical protein PKA13_13370 [Geminicoccaceae bacterium]|nr:hypothetical protein [Geminicoccaceae bacterium]
MIVIYAVNYDLKKPGQDYSALYDAIKSCGAWWHYLGSTWLVDTNLSADGIWKRLAPHADKNDLFLIIGVTNEHSGWLPREAWNWINGRRSAAA